MMKTLIAKRYIRAIKESVDTAAFENICTVFDAIAAEFEDPKFEQMINNPEVSDSEKEAVLLAGVKGAKSIQLDNLMRLLVENGRVEIIPAIATEMKKEIARDKKSYSGVVYSNDAMDPKSMADLGKDLGKKVGADITLEFVKTDFDGIKVEVEDLGIEIDFSKSRMNMQVVEHILKAI
jgi:F-type H+-transporting ATPase subunit delta